MIVCFAACPATGVIADLFESLTRLLADEATPVVGLVSEPFAFEDLPHRTAITYRRPLGLLTRSGRRALATLRRQHPQELLIWSQHPLGFLAAIGVKADRTIAWWHEPRHRGQVGRTTAAGYRLYELLVIRRADVIVVASPAVLETVPERYRDKTRVVPLPPLDAFSQPSPRFLDDPRDLVFFGVLAPHKGLDVLAEALEQLRTRGRTPTLRILGPGDLRLAAPRMSQLAEAHPDQIDVVAGLSTPEDIASAIVHTTAVVLPYLTAAGTATTSICHRLGTPVLATATGSFVDDIDHGLNGWLVPTDDASQLADGIVTALDRPVRVPVSDVVDWASVFRHAISTCGDK